MSNDETTTKKSPSFGKIMLASGIGTLIVLVLIGFFKLLVFLGIIGSLNSDSSVVINKNSFLKIDLTQSVSERTPSELDGLITDGADVGFSDMLRCISAAANDERINGIYLYFGTSYPMSWGKSEELRQALIDFRASGKPILAYADNYSQQGYFVASVADNIFLNPSGLVEFRGIGAESLFFKEMLDRLAVKMTLVRPKSNSYKSAGEMYTMDHFSESNRKQVREYIVSIWEYVTAKIADARDISIEQLNAMADDLTACLPEDAVKSGLIDTLCFENDIKTRMKDEYKGLQTVTLSEYAKTLKNNIAAKQQIAVIYAEGDVVAGTGFNRAVFSDKITKALDAAANDEKIKAIVLRVNSPGGQVTASEIMTDAVQNKRSPSLCRWATWQRRQDTRFRATPTILLRNRQPSRAQLVSLPPFRK